jgi:hypothetical protein
MALSAVGALVGPAAAETVTSSCRGTCGYWIAYDDALANQGATCTYKATATSFGDHVIKKIIVNPPQMNGSHPEMTPVSWRFKVQRRQSESVEGPIHTTIVYTSGWQTAQANTTATAYIGFGFTTRGWLVRADPSTAIMSSYRVFVNMRWSDGAGNIEGRETIRYDWYDETLGSDTRIANERCQGVFPD